MGETGDDRVGGVAGIAAKGFDRDTTDYESARPDYPAGVLDLLADRLGLDDGARVADLGAGTGKLTRLLAERHRTIAVEPVAGMRDGFAEACPGLPLAGAVGERLPFRAGSLDAVTVAQAFHWFRPEPALVELHRVLRSGGGLALLWNVRDEAQAWQRDLSALLRRYRAGVPSYQANGWRTVLEASVRFGAVTRDQIVWDQPADRERALARVRSISFVAVLPEAEREALLAEVGELVDRHPDLRGRGEFAFPYRTEVYTCRAR